MRLWLSYQRYALSLFALGALPAALVAAWAPSSLPGWLIAAALFAGLGGFAIQIARRWPEKRRATWIGMRRIEAGRFHPRQIRNYCGDPCFRLVAAELLTRAGLPRRERRRIIRGYARELREPVFFLKVDHARASVRVNESQVGSLLTETANNGEPG